MSARPEDTQERLKTPYTEFLEMKVADQARTIRFLETIIKGYRDSSYAKFKEEREAPVQDTEDAEREEEKGKIRSEAREKTDSLVESVNSVLVCLRNIEHYEEARAREAVRHAKQHRYSLTPEE